MKSFEKELPRGYHAVHTVDATGKKLGLLLNGAALILMAVIIVIGYLVIRPADFLGNLSILRMGIGLALLLAYIVLHELTHGAAYKLLTGQKLTFGITLSVAYCGVPDIYVYRRASLIALLSPFVVFTLVFGAGLLLPGEWDRFLALILLAVHIGGCAGDLYDTGLYLFRFRDPRTLMRDTGPKQTFYQP